MNVIILMLNNFSCIFVVILAVVMLYLVLFLFLFLLILLLNLGDRMLDLGYALLGIWFKNLIRT